MASAAASSDYIASSGAASSSYTYSNFSDNNASPKFGDYRSRVMLGDLPQDFLRLQFTHAQIYDPTGYSMRQAYPSVVSQQQLHQNPNFLGYFTLTIVEAKLIKNSGLLGLIRMDPYVSFRIGHVSFDTPVAPSGGKNPQWKRSYRINLFKGMDRIHLEIYDQRNFTEDSFIGECDIVIPLEVMDGETRQCWCPLMGRPPNANENQGDILIVMSFMSVGATNRASVRTPTAKSDMNSSGNANSSSSNTPLGLPTQSVNMNEQQQELEAERSPSAVPKPPPPPYSPEDVRTIEEMFPTVDRQLIIDLLDKNHGDKDLVVNHLLQNMT